MQRFVLGVLGLLLVDGASFNHRVQYEVAPLNGAIRVAKWIEVVGPLDDAGKHRALSQIQLLNILAKVRLCGLAESINREAAALAQVDLVRVRLENLFLREAMFQVKGHEDLRDLVLDGAGVGEEQELRQLHGKGGSAATMLAVADNVVPCPTDHAGVIHAAVLKELAVFDGQNGLHKVGWNRIVRQKAAFRAVRVFAQSCNQQRLQLVTRKRLPMVVSDRVDLTSARVNRGSIRRVVRLWSGVNGNRIRGLCKGAHLRRVRKPIDRITGRPQFCGDEMGAHFLSGTHFAGRCVDLCCIGKQGLLQPVIDDARVLVVVKGEYYEPDNSNEQDNADNPTDQPRRPGETRPGKFEFWLLYPDLQCHSCALNSATKFLYFCSRANVVAPPSARLCFVPNVANDRAGS